MRKQFRPFLRKGGSGLPTARLSGRGQGDADRPVLGLVYTIQDSN